MLSWAHISLAGSFGALLVGVRGARAALSIERLPTFFFFTRAQMRLLWITTLSKVKCSTVSNNLLRSTDLSGSYITE